MTDDAPQRCSCNEFIALIVYLNSQDLLMLLVLSLYPTHTSLCLFFLCCSHVASCLYCVFGVAKSQAVSWEHFHMARTSRVKPMSLGFSNPRISRCFIMAMNSLLLSSPFPEEDRRGEEKGERGDRQGREMMKYYRKSQ